MRGAYFIIRTSTSFGSSFVQPVTAYAMAGPFFLRFFVPWGTGHKVRRREYRRDFGFIAPDLVPLRTVRGPNTKFTRGCDPLGNHERLCSGDRGRACFAGTVQIGCRCDDGLDVRGEARRRPGCPFGFG